MSNPPKYQQLSQDDKTNADQAYPRSSLESLPPTYPPSSSSAAVGYGSHVIYTFVPRYPHLDLGERQDILGVLGRDPMETSSIIYRAFPKLQSYPLEFLAPVDVDATGKVADDRWAPIMDEAWSRFADANRAPSRIKVQIVDQDSDAEDRQTWLKNKERKNNCMAISFIVAPILLFTVVVGTLGILYGGDD